jgi:hypothetical protein
MRIMGKESKEGRKVKTRVLYSAMVLVLITGMALLITGPVMAQTANSVVMLLSVSPGTTTSDGTLYYTVTLMNLVMTGANNARLDVVFYPPGPTGAQGAYGTPVTLDTDRVIAVGETVVYNWDGSGGAETRPALAVDLGAIPLDEGVTVVYAQSEYDGAYIHDPEYDAYEVDDIPAQVIWPDIDIEKYVWDGADWQDADSATGPYLPSTQDPVVFRFVVTNNGTVDLTSVNLTDTDMSAFYTDVACTNLASFPTNLAVNETKIYYSELAWAAGQHEDEATAVGQPPIGNPVSDSDPAYYFGAEVGIHIEKYTNGEDADSPTGPHIVAGGSVTWTYNVTNTGALNLSGILVTDDHPGVNPAYLSGDNGDGILNPGESWIYQATGVAAAGQYANTGTVVGYYDSAQVTDSDPSHYLGLGPGIDIEKHTNGEDADVPTGPSIPVGGTVNWTYYVSNTGDVALTGILVTDNQPGVTPVYVSGDDGDGALNVTEIWIYQATGVAVVGQYANIGTVVGYYGAVPVTDSDPSHYLGLGPGIDIEKHTNGVDADTAPGPYISINSSVTWTYIVTNTGDLDLTGIIVTDDHVGVIPVYVSGDNGDGILNPGEIWIYQASGIAEAGQYANVGTVTGTPPVGADVSDSDPSHYYNRPTNVGWETYPVNKLRVLLPWIALLAAIIAGASLLVLRRRRVTS